MEAGMKQTWRVGFKWWQEMPLYPLNSGIKIYRMWKQPINIRKCFQLNPKLLVKV